MDMSQLLFGVGFFVTMFGGVYLDSQGKAYNASITVTIIGMLILLSGIAYYRYQEKRIRDNRRNRRIERLERERRELRRQA